MITARVARPTTVVVALSVPTACATPLNLPPSHETVWNAVRATIASASAKPVERIVRARGIAIREDLSLRNGTIDVDLEPPRASQFAGIAFRVAGSADCEMLYLRNHGGCWTR